MAREQPLLLRASSRLLGVSLVQLSSVKMHLPLIQEHFFLRHEGPHARPRSPGHKGDRDIHALPQALAVCRPQGALMGVAKQTPTVKLIVALSWGIHYHHRKGSGFLAVPGFGREGHPSSLHESDGTP